MIFNCVFLLLLHPIYISTSDVIFDAQGSWSGTIKVFYDDLEDALQNQGGKRPNLTSENLEQYYPQMYIYLSANLRFMQGQILSYRLVSASRLGDIITISFHGNTKWEPNPLTISNTLLLDLFESQKNIMTIRRNSDSNFFYLRKGLTSKSIDLSD